MIAEGQGGSPTLLQHSAPLQLLLPRLQFVRCYIRHYQEVSLDRWRGRKGLWIAPQETRSISQFRWVLGPANAAPMKALHEQVTVIVLVYVSIARIEAVMGMAEDGFRWDCRRSGAKDCDCALTAAWTSSSTSLIPSESLREMAPEARRRSWFLIAWPWISGCKKEDEYVPRLNAGNISIG